jgi:hypothetical protein
MAYSIALANRYYRLFLPSHNQKKMVIQLIGLLTYTTISGVKDGILWSRQGSDAFKWNEHIVFGIERTSIALLPLLFLTIGFSYIDYAVLMFVWLFMFSFIHNGFYYETRKRIDMPLCDWFHDSETSTAWFETDIITRTLCFIIGILVLSYYIICIKQS